MTLSRSGRAALVLCRERAPALLASNELTGNPFWTFELVKSSGNFQVLIGAMMASA